MIKEIVQKESFSNPLGDTTIRPQKRMGSEKSVVGSEKTQKVIDELIQTKFKALTIQDLRKVREQINKAIEDVLNDFELTPVYEEREYGPGSYDYKFAHKPENKRKHAARNRANRAAVKAGRKKVGDGKDVHHPKGHSDSSPTQVMPQSQNRGMADEGGRKKK